MESPAGMVTLVVAPGTAWILPGIFQDGVQLVGLPQLLFTEPYQMAVGGGEAVARAPKSKIVATTRTAIPLMPPTTNPNPFFIYIIV